MERAWEFWRRYEVSKMEFVHDLSELRPPNKVTFSLVGMKMPTNKDVYIRALEKQIIEQYESARIFMYETETPDWRHWFQKPEQEFAEEAFEWIFRSKFLECALMYYNIIVDLSWTLCYVAAEFSLDSNGGTRQPFEGITTLEEATALLKKAQGNVSAPTAENNPFGYLKKMNPAFESAIDMIIALWNDFQDSPIRQLYNYCKHKGKPLYNEIETCKGDNKLMQVFFEPIGEDKFEMPIESADVMKRVSITSTVRDLQKFDDEKLFPYIKSLFDEINRVAQVSPIVR